MQQNCVETLQSDRESLIQELSLLVVGRDWRDSVAQSIQKFHSRFVDWAQGFQCYRLNKMAADNDAYLANFLDAAISAAAPADDADACM